ncbi:MAG TPA: glycosyltransferase family 4 protein [Vicinamibacterales bacterium]|nr:glycosyltransferase family 4 protein [Vicinamibacterales bacterium]
MTRGAAPRVLHLVPALFGPGGVTGGAERYALELARHMADAVPTRLLTFGDRDARTCEGNLDIRVVGGAWHVRGQPTNPFSMAVFPEILRSDVVHCHQHHILASSAAAIVCRATGRRVFATDLGGGGWDVSAYISTDRWFNGHLHISEYSRMISGQAGKPWARVVLGGVDTDRFSPDPLTPRGCTPLFVGRLLPHKGVNDLIAALPANMALDVVGPLNTTGNVEALKAQAAGKRVTFRHDVDDGGLLEAYRRALCLVLPSVYRANNAAETKVPELLGQTLLEAMACATPVICTRVASMPEVVDDGVTGFIVEAGDHRSLGDRLSWLAAHPAEAAAMGAAGRRAVLQRFQWTQVVDRCLDAYASL